MSAVKSNKGTAPVASKLLTEQSPFHLREAFKNLRSNLLFTLATTDRKSFAVTSSLPNEGKSTLACNLALTMAQTGSQVLLMDCDLRKPAVHRIFRVKNERGVTSVLLGMHTIEEALHQDVAPNLDLLVGGPLSPNPSELLGSAQMTELLNIVQKAYDYVILDTPPVNVVLDALIVARHTAGVMLVTREGKTRHDQVRRALEQCEFADVKVLGMVVNDVQIRADGRYYGRYSYQQAYYGPAYGEQHNAR